MKDGEIKYTACYVRKRKDRRRNPYVVMLSGFFYLDGKRVRKQTCVGSYHRKSDALDEKTKREYSIKTSSLVVPNNITTGEFLEGWLEDYIETGDYKYRTKEAYRSVMVNHIIPSIGQLPLQDVTATDIEKYYASCRKGDNRLAEATIQQHCAILHKAFKVAVNSKKLIPRNPVESAEGRPKKSRMKRIVRYWNEEECDLVLRAASDMGTRQAAMYTLALETGMRLSEICGLSWNDICLRKDMGEIVVRKQLVKSGRAWKLDTTKNRRERKITISNALINKLICWKEVQDAIKSGNKGYLDKGLVFTNSDGLPIQKNNIGEREFGKLIKDAKVSRIRFHDMRHTNATLLLAKGYNIKVVSERLGHSNVTTTMEIYWHVLDETHRRVAQSFDNRDKYRRMPKSGEISIYSYEEDRKTVQETPKH